MLDLDPEVPPEAEGETGGDGDVVRQIVVGSPLVPLAAIVSNRVAASTAHPWTTVTARP
jgi:hypothetical protein